MRSTTNFPLLFVGIALLVSSWLSSCTAKKNYTEPVPSLFKVLTENETGLHFANILKPTESFNMFHYMYYYNGAGVGAGDFNNDGLVDLFFAGNEVSSAIFINQGKLQFKEVTAQTNIPNDSAWNTGVSVVDINNDGLLDIYVCRLGNFEKFHSKNLLLVCQGIINGIPQYKDEAASYGLDFSGFSTQMNFFDYDLDGDLDAFLLNHSVHQNGTFAPRKEFLGTYHPLSGDRMYRNDGKHFTDVTRASNINSSAISYGLGVVNGDLNLDGWPDLYAGNDFHENDYLYINQKNGTFKDEGHERMMHTSQYSMGVDIADANNDGYPEIVSMDMLPKDPYILKRSLGEDDYDIYKYKISVGYDYQFTRNNLQWNRKNGLFSEIGMYSNIYASDWSWATFFMDFDNDGLKDLFIANGIPKRMNDMDYVNYVSNREIQDKIRDNQMGAKDMALIDKFPEIKIPNQFYLNKGNFNFQDISSGVTGNPQSYSNGAAYADLDNDGDLDMVVNNVNDPVFIYENTINQQVANKYVRLQLKGSDRNIRAVGAKLVLFANDGIRTYEKYPVRGFLSSMESPLNVGLRTSKIDSAFLIWPDNSYQLLHIDTSKNETILLEYKPGLPAFDYTRITSTYHPELYALEDITAATGIQFLHQENVFQEFNREQLIPHMNSTEGPALAVADVNKDGLEDIYIGAARSFQRQLYLQQKDGRFLKTIQPSLQADSNLEDVDALWSDVNKDGHFDLVVATGGNEYYGKDENLLSRVYLNDGKGLLTKKTGAIPVYTQASRLVQTDVNEDGYPDFFLFSRVTAMNYGKLPDSYLLVNQGDGSFREGTEQYAPALKGMGMVTWADKADLDGDGDQDLAISFEWGGIDALILNKGKYEKKSLCKESGWWSFLLPVDIDKDGDIDLVAGNLGLNTRLKATKEQPISLYYNDFDDNGRAEQIMTYYVQNKEIPFANKDEIQRQIPIIKKKFLYAEDFAKANFNQFFSPEKMKSSTVLKAWHFGNALMMNDGKGNFELKDLPWQAQLTTYRTGLVVDLNKDQSPDLLLLGNFYDNNVQMGRYDADFGTCLLNKGNGELEVMPVAGSLVKGQVRRMANISLAGGNKGYVLAKNSDSLKVVKFKK